MSQYFSKLETVSIIWGAKKHYIKAKNSGLFSLYQRNGINVKVSERNSKSNNLETCFLKIKIRDKFKHPNSFIGSPCSWTRYWYIGRIPRSFPIVNYSFKCMCVFNSGLVGPRISPLKMCYIPPRGQKKAFHFVHHSYVYIHCYYSILTKV